MMLIIAGFGGTLFLDSFWGLTVFSVFTHITPQQLSREIIVPLRLPLCLSLLTLFSYLMSSAYPRKFSRYPAEFWLMGLMLAGMLMGSFNALDVEIVYEKSGTFFKFMVFYLLMVNLIDSDYKFKWFINAQILSAAWLVYRCWDMRHRFSYRFENIDGGVISDSNHFAAAVVLLFPLVVRRMLSGHWAIRFGAAVGAFGMLMTIVITGSRGGFLGLAVQTLAFVYFYKQYRKRIVITLICLMIALAPFISDYYVQRVVGIFSHEDIEDSRAKDSVNSRLTSWKLSLETWEKMPVFGCGIGNFGYYMGYYHEGLSWGEKGHVAHSLWLQVLGEGGLMVFIPFSLILLLFFRRSFAASRYYSETDQLESAQDIYAIQIGLVGFLVCATFLNRLFYEPIYWFSGLAVISADIVTRKMYAEQEE